MCWFAMLSTLVMDWSSSLQVVAHDEERAVEARQLVEQPALGGTVEVVRRLVEDHQLGLLEEHAHEVDATALATGERVDVLQEELLAQAEAVGQTGHHRFGLVAAVGLELLLQVREQLDVLLAWDRRPWRRGRCPAHRRGRRGRGPRGCARSRSARGPRPPGTGACGQVPERPEDADVAPVAQLRRRLPHQHRDEGRLAGPVAPHQAHLLAGADHEGGVREQGAVADFDGEG